MRGIGRWTVEMFLMFELGRPDVLPLDDFGVRKGFTRVFGSRGSERLDREHLAGCAANAGGRTAAWRAGICGAGRTPGSSAEGSGDQVRTK